jgi:N-acetylneuraminic acid mutarotase
MKTVKILSLVSLLSLLAFSSTAFAQGGWQTRAPMPTSRSGIAAAALERKIFVFGGESGTGTFNQNESYDPVANVWQAWTRMPTARHGLGVAVVGKTIFVVSGGPRPGASFSGLNEAFTP